MRTGLLFLASSLLGSSLACSRVTYKAGVDDRITIGRSMNFVGDTKTAIWAFPAGLQRNGSVDENSLQWTSKYGSITAVCYNAVYTEGMNSEGLTGSTLYLGSSDFGTRNTSVPGMFVGTWLQYFLDSYATVAEAVDDICQAGEEKFQVVDLPVVPNIATSLHLSFSDLGGDNLILEYTDGELQCYHSPNYSVMTNEPSFDQQLAIDAYWSPVSNFSLPGTSRPADRFARLSHYNKQIPSAPDLETAVSYTAGMIRAVSSPILPIDLEHIATEDVWPTLWRFDTLDKIMFYESATSPMFFWVDANEFDLTKDGKTKVLNLTDVSWTERIGNMTDRFVLESSDSCIGLTC